MTLKITDFASMPRWVGWEFAKSNGRTTKVPKALNGRNASCADPATWATRADCEAARTRNSLSGVGIVLGDLENGYTLAGIDLDSCIAGGVTAGWAESVISQFATYTEISPSRTGLKLFFLLRDSDAAMVRDLLRGRGRTWKSQAAGDHPPALEIYTGGRYFTVTDQATGTLDLAVIEADQIRWLVQHASETFPAPDREGDDNSRSARAFRIARQVHAAGGDYSEFKKALAANAMCAGWLEEKGLADGERQVRRAWEKSSNTEQHSQTPSGGEGKRLISLTAEQLLQLRLPPRQHALTPILPLPGLAMIYAPRGVGKTFVALSVSFAISTGGSVMRWHAQRPLRVLHVDGEMPATALQERLAQITGARGVAPHQENLRFLIGDLAHDGLPNIATPEGRTAIEQAAEDVDVLTLDNVSTLAYGLRENEADDWGELQAWLMRLRRKGKLVILIHHAGKGGKQRGTSRREDALDTVIALRHPQDYSHEEGARFELHVEKARGAMGSAVAPFQARLTEEEGVGLTWSLSELGSARAVEMLRQGASLRKIQAATGVSKSAAHRLKTQL